MRAIFAAVLLVGLGIAGFAVYVAQNYISGYEAALAQQRDENPVIETVDAFIVARQMKFGEKLEIKDVRKVKWPKSAVPEGMFTDPEVIFPDGNNIQRVILRTMERGEVLIAAKVTEPGEEAGISSRLDKGQRAITIKVNATSGVSGHVRPGDRVDIFWTGSLEDDVADRGEFTKLITANLHVIAVDQSINEEVKQAKVARTITVAANSSREVGALTQAQNTGRLSLALVGAGDDTIAETVEVDQRSLLGLPEEVAPKAVVEVEEERICTIKTRKGAEVVQIPIPCTN